MKDVGSQLSLSRHSSEVKSAIHIDEPIQESGTDGRSDELTDHIAEEILGGEFTGDPHTERNRGVYVATGDVAYTVTEANEHESEAETDAQNADLRARKDSEPLRLRFPLYGQSVIDRKSVV